MELHERLKKLRTDQKLSVYRLSRISDVSENHIRTIEKGNSHPSVETLENLLRPLGITMSEFFRDDESIIFPSSYEKELLQAVRKLDAKKSDILLLLAKILGDELP